MEALYSKLYDKYNQLKTKKMTELDQLNKDQEVKFMNYVAAAEELIQHLKNENERLHTQNNDLRNEAASTRVSEEYAEYKKLWMEENQKNKALTEEVERLQKLQHKGGSSKQKGSENRQSATPQIVVPGPSFDSPSERMTRSKRRKLSATEASAATHQDSGQVASVQEESRKDLHKETAAPSETLVIVKQPECCRRTISLSGEGSHENDTANCQFQELVECMVGMKFSVMTRNEGLCISAEHQSSGYSFSLTWLEKANEKEVDLQYNVLSLGTLERVAPGWMKEAIMFSPSMCPIFFDRVTRFAKSLS